ncbi:hypothetical protein [Bacillus solimangrovi]|uniref:Uncharacterized protein n=1 Tax=Bacillus solimangrovi TaxID=1305675 RepID=A0A1E5LD69_9BACI|nr:hypothetical protein [Bacillus solimangrovi]OEH92010.1 hypothetical protein BFG57_17245 [Bacillus solimangrovi]
MDEHERERGWMDTGQSVSENMGLPNNSMGGTISVTLGNGTLSHNYKNDFKARTYNQGRKRK